MAFANRSTFMQENAGLFEKQRDLQAVCALFKQNLDIIDCNQFPYLHCFPSKLISQLKSIPLVITWHEFWGDYWYQYLGSSDPLGS